MPLEPGARLGVYEITGAIGAGAMGAVAPAPAAPPPRRRSLIWVAIALLTAVVVGLAAYVTYLQRPAGVPQVHKTYVALRPDGSSIRFPALSLDGRTQVLIDRLIDHLVPPPAA